MRIIHGLSRRLVPPSVSAGYAETPASSVIAPRTKQRAVRNVPSLLTARTLSWIVTDVRDGHHSIAVPVAPGNVLVEVVNAGACS